MKKTTIILAFLAVFSNAFSQEDETLLTVNNEAVSVADFKRVYEKNLDLVKDEDSKNIDKYLDLFVNYKLKVQQAYQQKLDTNKSYKRELASYKNQLSAPYLQDNKLIDKLVEEAYYRTKNEVKAKHILVSFPKGMQPNDTLKYYQKIMDLRDRITKNGESFEDVAAKYSEDPSARYNKQLNRGGNRGNLGYFNAFKMVYPFEDAVYKTKVGDVSMPFQTRFGYHIVTVDDLRQSKGEFEVAHILAKDRTVAGKTKIEAAYKALQNGLSFEEAAKQFSEDAGSAVKGGKLPKFGTGRMVEEFEKQVYSLKKEGAYSKPFKTKFGWHIVKLIKNYPVPALEDVKTKITQRVKRSGRARMSNDAVINKLKKRYKINVNNDALQLFSKNRREFPKDSMQATLLTINDKKIKQEEFSKFIKFRRHLDVNSLLQMFIDNQTIAYFKENLEFTEPEYKHTLQEYKDGLLLFDLMQKNIWDKASKDTIALQNYFNKQAKFKGKKLAEVKGQAVSDFQEYLEQKWVADLRKDARIKVNKKALRRFKKQYNQ